MVSFPRFVRPHKVYIKHKINEDDDFNGVYEETCLQYVKFDDNSNLGQSSSGKERDTSSILTIDCGDLYAVKNGIRCKYINSRKYSSQYNYFTIFVGDIIVFNCEEFVVNSINEINPFGIEPLFIEVRCNG